jgi:hypothetical protein
MQQCAETGRADRRPVEKTGGAWYFDFVLSFRVFSFRFLSFLIELFCDVTAGRYDNTGETGETGVRQSLWSRSCAVAGFPAALR